MLAWVIAAMVLLSPNVGPRSMGLAEAIARHAESSPLYAGTDAPSRTAALLVAVTFRESSFRPDAVGDRDAKGAPHSFCAMQIHDTAGGHRGLLADVDACVAAGLAILRQSLTVCPKHPLAFYARGPKGCTSETAQRISRDRVALADRLLREVTP